MALRQLIKKGKIEDAAAYWRSLDPRQRTHELDFALFAECNEDGFDMEVIEWLIANGADVNARFNNCSVIGTAAVVTTERTFGLIDYLVQHGVVPEKSSDVIIQAVRGRIEEGCYLVENSPLYQRMLLHLLQYHFDPNYTDETGRTALHHIAEAYSASYDLNLASDLIPILLANGARTDMKDDNGETPRFIAVGRGDMKTLAMFSFAHKAN